MIEILSKIDGMIVTWNAYPLTMWELLKNERGLQKLVNKLDFNASINLLSLKPLL